MPNYQFAYHSHAADSDDHTDFGRDVRRAIIRRVLIVAALAAGAGVLIFA